MNKYMSYLNLLDNLSLLPDQCAVIDEIQLLRDRERGWGWTNAFLGMIHIEFSSPLLIN